jgi:ABC-type transport system involved in multi-copper enzyme maturation permease subunit
MLHLVKLEWRKFRLGGIFKVAVIANLCIMGFILLIGWDGKNEGDPAFGNYAEAFTVVGMFVQMTFVIYASVLLAKIVVEEYRNHTICLLFLYPISRKKLLAAKLLAVSAITFGLIIVSDVLVSTWFYFLNEKQHYVTDPLTAGLLVKQGLRFLLHAASATGMSLIPLFIGMRKKSVPATIVSSILIVALLNSGDAGSTLSSVIAVPILFGIAGVCIAYLSVRNVEHTDV